MSDAVCTHLDQINWPATWPEGVRLQMHILEGDEDFEIAQGLATTVSGAELFVYPAPSTISPNTTIRPPRC